MFKQMKMANFIKNLSSHKTFASHLNSPRNPKGASGRPQLSGANCQRTPTKSPFKSSPNKSRKMNSVNEGMSHEDRIDNSHVMASSSSPRPSPNKTQRKRTESSVSRMSVEYYLHFNRLMLLHSHSHTINILLL